RFSARRFPAFFRRLPSRYGLSLRRPPAPPIHSRPHLGLRLPRLLRRPFFRQTSPRPAHLSEENLGRLPSRPRRLAPSRLRLPFLAHHPSQSPPHHVHPRQHRRPNGRPPRIRLQT